MMTMFSLHELMDTKKAYQKACMEIVHRRAKAIIDSMGRRAGYAGAATRHRSGPLPPA
jgi:hypothetical protein